MVLIGKFQSILLLSLGAICLLPATSKAQVFRGLPNWQYIPLNESLVRDADKFPGLDRSTVDRAQSIRESKSGTSEEGEARMVIAQMCKRSGLDYCAFHMALTTVQDYPGSTPAMWAMTMLEQLLMERSFSEKKIQRLINTGSFKDVPDKLLPMTSYFVALDNSDKKLPSWMPTPIKAMGEKNYWIFRWRYLTALEESRRKSPDIGIRKLENLLGVIESEPTYAKLKNEIVWQLARFKFEHGDYDESLKLYAMLKPEARLAGRVLLERAWVHYSRGDYAETLGLLQSLKAPYFVPSNDPEQFLLEMLTLRKLCYFNSVHGPAAIFSDRYQTALDQIRKRKPLSDNLQLTRLSFMRANYDPEVETVSLIRDEKKKIKSMTGLLSGPLVNELEVAYDKDETQMREDLEFNLKTDLVAEADRLLDLSDQIQLVEYLSGLDAFRIQQGGLKKSYESTAPPTGAFHTLYWPVEGGEFWSDELSNYQVLVSDRCSERGP